MVRGNEGKTYPSRVRQILIKRSAPQPATTHTPTGGTISIISFRSKNGVVSDARKMVIKTRKTAEMTPMMLVC
jgi:hypothetical protein